MKPTKTLLIILFLLAVFSLSYLKNTFVVNLFSPDYDFLVQRFRGTEIHEMGRPLLNGDMGNNPRVSSVLVFHFLFALLNSAFIFLIFRKIHFQKLHWKAFGGLSIIIALTYAIYIRTGENAFYEAGLIIKDFLQSSVYSFVFVIVALNYRLFISKDDGNT
jgi:hypothetical protein